MDSQIAPETLAEPKQDVAAAERIRRMRPFFLRSLIFCASFIALTIYFFAAFDVTKNLHTYQERWHPALAFACTGKMGVISLDDVPAPRGDIAGQEISAFMKVGGTPSYDCAAFPPEAKILPFSAEANHQRFFHRFQIGLYTLTGLLWMVTGPSWNTVGVLSSAFAAAAATILFCTVRRFAGIAPAIVLTALFAIHPLHGVMVPATRDYTKTLFVFSTFACLLWLVTHRFSSLRAYLASCLGLGAFLGIGVSFRQDMLTTSILATAVIALIPPLFVKSAKNNQHQITWKISLRGAIALAFGTLLFVAPLYAFVPVDHGNEAHFMILGLSQAAFERTGQSTGDFILNAVYQDVPGWSVIQSWIMAYTGAEAVPAYSQEYNDLSRLVFLDYAVTFPQFVFGRIYMIALDITTSWSLIGHKVPAISWLLALNSLVALISAYVYNKRVFALLVTFFFGMSAILSLQYLPRHYFHIHSLWLAVAGSLSAFGVVQFLQRKTELGPLSRWISYLANPAAASYPKAVAGWLIPSLFIGAVAGFLAIKAWGTYTPSAWVDVVLSQPVQDARYTVQTGTGDQALVRLDPSASFPSFAGKEITSDDARAYPQSTLTGGYLEMRFASSRECSRPSVDAKLVYSAWHPQADLSHDFVVKLGEERTTSRFLPVYFTTGLGLEAISFSHEDVKCLLSMHWVQNFPAIRLPVEFTSAR